MRIDLLTIILMASIGLAGCGKSTIGLARFSGGALDIREVDFDYFQGKMKLGIKDKDSEVRAKATVRIRKDSVIWMTFSGAAGITGGKCLINKDSITILNSLQNEYFVFYYPELTQRFRFTINYEIIEAAALGNLILKRKGSDKAAKADELMVLKQKSEAVQVSNYVDQETHKVVRVDMIESASKNTASVHYQDFQQVGDQLFPHAGVIALFYSSQNVTYNTTIEFDYSKIEIFDKPLRFPFKIPKKYVAR